MIGGGSYAYADYANATMSQWFNACTSAGTYNYPYGSTYNATICNGADLGKATTTVVGSLAGCQAPTTTAYAGVFDLNGNAYEWDDSAVKHVQDTLSRAAPPRSSEHGYMRVSEMSQGVLAIGGGGCSRTEPHHLH